MTNTKPESTTLNSEPFPNPEGLVLELYYHNASTVITAEQTPFQMGRDNNESGLAISCEFASRQHCAIEFHDDKFILKDFSRNGTFVQLSRSQIFRVLNETTPLIGNGSFKLGATIVVDDPERILFRVKKVAKKV